MSFFENSLLFIEVHSSIDELLIERGV